MIVVVQRVSSASVIVDDSLIAEIGYGYVVLLGIFDEDLEKDAEKLIDKILGLRIMADKDDKMNRSIFDVGGEILIVPQFTLCADTSSRRPSFMKAKEPKEAARLYKLFVEKIRERGIKAKTGKFAAMMKLSLINDGPVTFVIDSKKI